MASPLSSALQALLETVTSLPVRHALLNAGAPAVMSMLPQVRQTPSVLTSLDASTAALLVSVVEDSLLLEQIISLDTRQEVVMAARKNPHGRHVVAPAWSPEPLPPCLTTLEEVQDWVGVQRPTSEEFLLWLLRDAFDPTLLVEHYARGTFGRRDTRMLFLLQHHPEVMTLPEFYALVPSSEQQYLLGQTSYATKEIWEGPLVELYQQCNQRVPLWASFSLDALTLLGQSSRLADRAVFLAKTPTAALDLELFSSLSPDLQAGVLVHLKDPERQRLYARYLTYDSTATLEHDPLVLLYDDNLDWEGTLRVLHWADAEELLAYLCRATHSPAELTQVVEMALADGPHMCDPLSFRHALNESEPGGALMVILDISAHSLPGVVASALTYRPGFAATLDQRVLTLLETYAGADPGRWEMVLALGPTWNETLPELLECMSLTNIP